jgi:hypothetical protein
MDYVLYCSTAEVLRNLPSNAGIESAFARADELRRQGISVNLVDTSRMASDELQGRYLQSLGPSVLKKYRVRQIFGSRRRAGWLFGRGVPALVAVGPAGTVEDIYPHEAAGKLVTIFDFFDSLRQEVAPTGTATLRAARKRR